ncbi:GNAT family N-acetyltransferase [Acinetobacter sp. 187]|uniref:GNAT family N-acetyltransferase n=1 Tax=Acinetobacter lanii TaxID=2715163 RepID=UPI00140A8BBC|nr:GNAT family N-acetyltransferase [Acinetobacter lanii]NHC05060.1 GNAT family N-acetyltransferase [Acinetobacter lanii]
MIEIAQKKDAQAILRVIEKSIHDCILDHQNDPKIIQEWLSNKTVENISIWIENSYSFIYRQNKEIVGFILLSKTGILLLNYVLPETQRVGLGSILLKYICDVAKSNNIRKITLESTLTAKNFYLYNQFKIIENIYEKDKLIAYLMEKEI